MLKRFVLVMSTLSILVGFPACRCKTDRSGAKPVVTQVVPEKSVVAPKPASPRAETKVSVVVRPKAKQLKIKPKIEPKTEPKVEPKTEPKVEPKAEPKVEPKAEPKVEPKAEPPKTKPAQQVSIVDYWSVPQPFGMTKDIIGVTFVVKNATAKDVRARVVCHFIDDGALFGESMAQKIGAGSDAKLMVRGFKRCLIGCYEHFNCRVEPVR